MPSLGAQTDSPPLRKALALRLFAALRLHLSMRPWLPLPACRGYAPFTKAKKHDFQQNRFLHYHGSMFSSGERQQLVRYIIENETTGLNMEDSALAQSSDAMAVEESRLDRDLRALGVDRNALNGVTESMGDLERVMVCSILVDESRDKGITTTSDEDKHWRQRLTPKLSKLSIKELRMRQRTWDCIDEFFPMHDTAELNFLLHEWATRNVFMYAKDVLLHSQRILKLKPQERAKPKPGTRLHVRFVGEYATQDALEDLIEGLGFGDVEQVTIRHRMDANGRNTSWALVTMDSTYSAGRVLRGDLPGLMSCELFSEAKANKEMLEQHHDESKRKRPKCSKLIKQFWSAFSDQPLDEIRGYFGEQIALYFAFVGVYTQSLIWPAIFGLPTYYFHVEYGVEQNPLSYHYSVFMSFWSLFFLSTWKRRQNELSFLWGTQDYEETERPRSEFINEAKDPRNNDATYKVSKITGRMEAVATRPWVRWVKVAVGAVVLVAFIGIVMVLAQMATWIKLAPIHDSKLAAKIAGSMANSVAIVVFTKVWGVVAEKLTDWEDNRTETEYEDSQITKVFLFSAVNNFYVLFYIAFFKQGELGFPWLGLENRDSACTATAIPCSNGTVHERLLSECEDGWLQVPSCMSDLQFQVRTHTTRHSTKQGSRSTGGHSHTTLLRPAGSGTTAHCCRC